MKKILLLIAMFCILLTGCGKQENIEANNEQANQESYEYAEYPELSKSFEERAKEVIDYVNQEYKYVNFDDEHFIGDASLAKIDNYYLMKVDLHTLKTFTAEEIGNAYNLAQESGEYTYDGYTFYKDNTPPITFVEENAESLNEMLESYKQSGKVVTDSESGLWIIEPTPLDPNTYFVNVLAFAGGSWSVTRYDKTVNVVLLPSDKVSVLLNFSEDGEYDMTVEDFYNKAIVGEQLYNSEFETINYNIAHIGDSRGYYGGSQNALRFEDDTVKIYYTIGGI